MDGRMRPHWRCVDFTVPQIRHKFTEIVQAHIVSPHNAVSEFCGVAEWPPLNASIQCLVPIIDVHCGKLSNSAQTAEIRKRSQVHPDVSAQREVPTGLTTIGNQVVEALDVP